MISSLFSRPRVKRWTSCPSAARASESSDTLGLSLLHILNTNFPESVAKVKEILQLDNLNVDFKYGYKIFTLNSGNRYLIKTKFILFVESNRLLRRSLNMAVSYTHLTL